MKILHVIIMMFIGIQLYKYVKFCDEIIIIL